MGFGEWRSLKRGIIQRLLGAEASFYFSCLELPGCYLDLSCGISWFHLQTPLPVKGIEGLQKGGWGYQTPFYTLDEEIEAQRK